MTVKASHVFEKVQSHAQLFALCQPWINCKVKKSNKCFERFSFLQQLRCRLRSVFDLMSTRYLFSLSIFSILSLSLARTCLHQTSLNGAKRSRDLSWNHRRVIEQIITTSDAARDDYSLASMSCQTFQVQNDVFNFMTSHWMRWGLWL